MKTLLNRALAFVVAATATLGVAEANDDKRTVKLSFLDGRPAIVGVEEVNKALHSVGIRISQVAVPAEANPLVDASRSRALTEEEGKRLLALFPLHRGQLLDQISKAGRQPEAHRGGYLSTSEIGEAPYPKVFDMRAIPPEVLPFAQRKYSKLHVNSSDDGVGLDEVMTVASGGPWTWFFRVPEGQIAKLTVGPIGAGDSALRLSYPGLVPHGAFLNAPYGLTVAHAHGPKNFVMRYDEPSIDGADALGRNPWVDFAGASPKLTE
jgi:hypothetical protein